jgi:cell division protein FtsB
MDGQYFRKDQQRQTIGKWTKKLWKKKSFRIGTLVFIPALSFVLFSNRGVIQRINLESQKEDLVRQVEQLKKEQARLNEKSKLLESDPAMIEKIAREKFGMIRDGETVYKLKKGK